MSISITRDEWLKALQDAGIPATDEDDQSATTIKEFAQMFDLSENTAKYQLARLAAAGKAMVTRKKVTNEYGRTNAVKAYRLNP